MFGLLLCYAATVFIPRRLWLEGSKQVAVLFTLFSALCWIVSYSRILVDDDGVSFRPTFGNGSERRVTFEGITMSIPRVLGEPEHPIYLDIYCKGKRPTLRLQLKCFRQKDVAWLLSLPELKVQK